MMSCTFKITNTGISEDQAQNEYVVDGVKCPRLELNIGVTYIFKNDNDGCPLYITRDAIGGSNKLKDKLELQSDKSGNIIFIPTAEHKNMKLYYQCDRYRLMGNRIIII